MDFLSFCAFYRLPRNSDAEALFNTYLMRFIGEK